MSTQQKAGVDVPKAVRVAEAYCYDAGAPNAAKNLRATVAELICRNAELEAALRQSGEVVAWEWERFETDAFGDGGWWEKEWSEEYPQILYQEDLSDTKKYRNLRPLYAAPPATSGLVEGPAPRNRTEAAALAKVALAYLGVIDAHIDAAIARCETNAAHDARGGT